MGPLFLFFNGSWKYLAGYFKPTRDDSILMFLGFLWSSSGFWGLNTRNDPKMTEETKILGQSTHWDRLNKIKAPHEAAFRIRLF